MEPKMIEIVTDSKSIAQAMVDAAMKVFIIYLETSESSKYIDAKVIQLKYLLFKISSL